jgi:protein-S-isoprenylcysteine O-methyltransferase Ste14
MRVNIAKKGNEGWRVCSRFDCEGIIRGALKEKRMQLLPGILTVLLFLGYLILWRIKKNEMNRKEGVDPNVIFKATTPIQKYFGHLERIMTIIIGLLIILNFFNIKSTLFESQLVALNGTNADVIGFMIGIIGLTICRIAQVTIGKSWRVGIDESAKPGLITNGIYKYIRNPTYTGMYCLCIGVLLINPTILFSYWVLVFFIVMEFQVRCEEEYLERNYGRDYLDYCKTTKRYLPFVY